jgi:hypothetical protein
MEKTYNRIIGKLISRVKELRTIAIVGLSKNSGKTSFLNFLLSRIDSNKNCIGVMTTGRDGESIDLVFHSEKPMVSLPSNIIFSTFLSEANKQSPFIEILKVTNISTPLGRIVIARTINSIETQIIGPPNVKHQQRIIDFFYGYGSDMIFIDGSLNRKSILLSEDCNGVIYLAGASFSNRLDDIITELMKEYHKSQIPCIEDDKMKNELMGLSGKHGVVLKTGRDYLVYDSILTSYKEIRRIINQGSIVDYLFISTSFTDKVFEYLDLTLKRDKIKIIFSNSFNIILNSTNYYKFVNNHVYLLRNIPLIGIGVNSFSDKGDVMNCMNLRQKIAQNFPDVPVIDIMEPI